MYAGKKLCKGVSLALEVCQIKFAGKVVYMKCWLCSGENFTIKVKKGKVVRVECSDCGWKLDRKEVDELLGKITNRVRA